MGWTIFWAALGSISELIAALGAIGAFIFLIIQINNSKKQFIQDRYDSARPILSIVKYTLPIQSGNDRYPDWSARTASAMPIIEIKNVGNGAALNLRSVIYGPEAIAVPNPSIIQKSWIHNENEKDHHWHHWSTDIVQNNNEIKIMKYTFAHSMSRYKIEENSKFIETVKGKRYNFNASKQPLNSANVEATCIYRVVMTYENIFRIKHAVIFDLIYDQGWKIYYIEDPIVKDLEEIASVANA